MPNENLATYLNDHMAGSIAAVELLEHLEATHAATPWARTFAELRADVEADRRELRDLMRRQHIAESRPRKVTAWLTEKITQIKLRLDDPWGGSLRLLESLEVLSLGIEGKRSLWRALAAAENVEPGLQGVDYGRLEQRAEEQRHRVEAMRLEAATGAFRPS